MHSISDDRLGLRSSFLFILTCSVAATACSTNLTSSGLTKQISGSQARFEKSLAKGRCTEAAENIPENEGDIKFLGRVDRATGTVISYAATGAGYTADVALTIVGGAIVYTILSLPRALPQSPDNDGGYRGPVGKLDLPLPTMGSAVYNHTANLRCPDLTSLSVSVRRVADCLTRTSVEATKPADQTKLIDAKKTLDSVANNRDVMNCITPEEKSAVQSAEYKIDQLLARLPASAASSEKATTSK